MREALTRAIGDPRFVEAHPSGKAVVNGGANRKQTRNEPSDRPSAEDHPSLGEMRESGVRGILGLLFRLSLQLLRHRQRRSGMGVTGLALSRQPR